METPMIATLEISIKSGLMTRINLTAGKVQW